MRYFNTSGPNNPKDHYTLQRKELIEEGIELVKKKKYFTIWAPRQTGKSTYFKLLAEVLRKKDYRVAWVNLESFQRTTEKSLIETLKIDIKKFWNYNLKAKNFTDFQNEIRTISSFKAVLIIDEIEGLSEVYFNQFLHIIRTLYHSRESHCLKSVLLVGVSNILGIIQDNASPFNIADNLSMPYFTDKETFELLGQHEEETGQLFEAKVKEKISEITANQPGLVNGFAQYLIKNHPTKPLIKYEDYLKVEHWYLTKSIDKNIENIIKIAKRHRKFVERLLFVTLKVPFLIDRPAIKELHVNGLITWDEGNFIKFWVPIYQKRLFNALYPYTNGEGKYISETMIAPAYLLPEGKINFDELIDKYKKHITARSFRPYREKDKDGNFKSIPEAAMIYSFETFISIFIQELDGKMYREAFMSLGNTDLIININGFEYIIETKKYYSLSNYLKGKKQLAYYCKKAGLTEGIYIVYMKDHIKNDYVKEESEIINNILIKTYIIRYDEKRDF